MLLEPRRHLQRLGFVYLGHGRRIWWARRGSDKPPKIFFRKFVIGCHHPHIYRWLCLLLEPRRHLQRLGFVYFRPGAGRSWSQCLMSSRQVSGLRSHVRAPVPTPPAAPLARSAQCRALAPRPSPLPPPKTFLSIAKVSGQGRRTIGKHR